MTRASIQSTRSASTALIIAFAVLSAALVAPAAAQDTPAPSGLEREMAGIRVALEELVKVAKARSTGDQTELLMRRLEVATARLEPEETELRRRRQALESTASQVEQMDQMRQVWEQELAEQQGNDPEAEEGYRRQIAQFEAERERVERKRWQDEQKALSLEAALEERRALLRALEAEIDRRLGLE